MKEYIPSVPSCFNVVWLYLDSCDYNEAVHVAAFLRKVLFMSETINLGKSLSFTVSFLSSCKYIYINLSALLRLFIIMSYVSQGKFWISIVTL